MGGSGSTRWSRHIPKSRVDECKVLDMRDFTKAHTFQGRHALGFVEFPRRQDEQFPLPVHFAVEPLSNGNHLVTLRYIMLWKGSWEVTLVPILVQGTPPHFGGIRWWFTCPCSVDCRACARRVRKLYLPPGARYFGCRHCYDLTYRSVQEHDKRIDHLMKHPFIMVDRIKNGSPDLLTRRAYTRWYDTYLS
jgi:hypothetical protein